MTPGTARARSRPIRRMRACAWGDLAPGGPKGGHQATVHGRAVEPDRARAAVARVAALLDAKESALAQERAQALVRPGLRGQLPGVHGVVHRPAPASSARICSA